MCVSQFGVFCAHYSPLGRKETLFRTRIKGRGNRHKHEFSKNDFIHAISSKASSFILGRFASTLWLVLPYFTAVTHNILVL